MAERVLSERELNRALLARQLLLEPAKGPLPRLLERIGGIQAQYAPSMYVGLAARAAGFRREALTRALERRTQILPAEHRPRVFNTKTPQSVSTFLLDGQGAGTGRWERGGIVTEPFHRLDAAERRALDAEADRVAELDAP